MIIQHNLEAMNSMNCFGRVNKVFSKSTEKLSSGYKINRASDDAAGLTISEKMRWQIRGLNQSGRNINDGISYCNVAEGALGEIHSMLERMKELSVQAANDTNTDMDRDALDQETQQLKSQIDKIFEDTMFNTQKIWCEAYIPSADGTPTDFSFYNATDDRGTYVGGIEYMNHRYSWEDLGIGYDRATLTFTKTDTFKIDGTILKDDGSTDMDNYSSKASFTIKTVAGQGLTTAQKTYDWSAEDDGIAIDGIITTSKTKEEGNTTWAALGLTKGNDVKAGTYTFNYFGMEVSFYVKEDASWTTFVDGINNDRVKLDWHSDNVGYNNKQSADITKLNSQVVKVTNANKDKVSTSGYGISAKRDTLGIVYDKNYQSSVKWNDISDNDTGRNFINSWGTNEHGGSGNSDNIGTSDDNGSSKVTISDDCTYRFDDSASGGFINFDFVLDKTGSTESILKDLGYSRINVSTYAATSAVVNNTGTGTAGNTSATAGSNFDFNTQRDILGRQFASDTERITAGTAKIDNGKSVISLSAANGNPDYELTYNGDIAKELSSSIKDAVEQIKNAYKNSGANNGIPQDTDNLGLKSYSFIFKSGTDAISVSYDLSKLTYDDVKNLSGDADFDNLAKDIFNANSDITLSANGDAYQVLTPVNASVSEARVKNGVMVDGYVQDLNIQAGALSGQNIEIEYDYLRASNLGLSGISLKIADDSQSAINQVDKAIDRVSTERSKFGAYVNRLEHAYNVNMINSENTQASESRIRDTDMSKEMLEYSKNNILSQVGQTMLAQCNQNKNMVMQLLQ